MTDAERALATALHSEFWDAAVPGVPLKSTPLLILATLRAAGWALVPLPPDARLVAMTEGLVAALSSRDDAGNRLRFEWGEPRDGLWTPSIYAEDDGMRLVLAAEAELGRAWARVEEALPEGWYLGDLARFLKGWRATAFVQQPGGWADGLGPTPAAALDALAERLGAR